MLQEFRSQKLIWDKAKTTFYEPVQANSGDSNGRKLVVKILNNGVEEDLTGSTLSLSWQTRKGDFGGLDVFTPIDITKGEFEIYYTTGMLSNFGKLTASLVLTDASGVIESFPFVITICKSNVDSEAVQSDNSFTALTQALVDVSNLEATYAPRLTNVESHLADVVTGFDNVVANVTVDSEVILARDSSIKNKSFTTLDSRLEDIELTQAKFHYNHAAQEYVNVDKFWESFKNGKIYTVEFNQSNVSPSSSGTKKDDNVGLVCEPSTNTVKGRNDYENIGLFKSIDVNAYVDENDDYHVIAIKGDGRFKNDGSMGDVYVMAMPGYQKYYETDTTWGISYSDTMHSGFEVIHEAEKPDGTIRPYLLHAKYVAGRNPNENNNLASVSGVYPEFVNMSHDGQITEFKKKGVQYSGKTNHDDYYVQLMMWLKYATTISDTIMKGCQSYYLQYTNLVPEIGVKRVVITNAQANALLVGSTVSIGDYEGSTKTDDRQQARNYNKANRVNILSIEDLGDGNSAVYVDSAEVFDTTLATTITTYPWNSGGCNNVLGQDGSPYNNQSGKEPFIINGIEMMVGGYEVIQNKIIYNNNTDPNNYKIQIYVCYDCTKYSKGSPTTDYDLVSYELAQTNQVWKYVSKIGIDPNHPSILVPIEVEASSTTGFGDAIYTHTPATGYRVWQSLGHLGCGADGGLRCLLATNGLATANWDFLGRLSATGRSMG